MHADFIPLYRGNRMLGVRITGITDLNARNFRRGDEWGPAI
jgi:hypothetical protein